jgi:ATP dependent DNA ligase domain
MTAARPSGFIAPCIPTRAPKPPVGPDWIHEIKHDGYRLIVRRDGENVRLYTRRGYDWSDRYPAIARAAAKLRATSFTIDGEPRCAGRMAWQSSIPCTAAAPSPRHWPKVKNPDSPAMVRHREGNW